MEKVSNLNGAGYLTDPAHFYIEKLTKLNLVSFSDYCQ